MEFSSASVWPVLACATRALPAAGLAEDCLAEAELAPVSTSSNTSIVSVVAATLWVGSFSAKRADVRVERREPAV